jgi:hypothetical protein
MSTSKSRRTGTRVNLTLPDELHDTLKNIVDHMSGQTVGGFIRGNLMQLLPHFIQMEAALSAQKIEDAEGAFKLMRTMAENARAQADLLDRQVDGYEQAIAIAKKQAADEQISA